MRRALAFAVAVWMLAALARPVAAQEPPPPPPPPRPPQTLPPAVVVEKSIVLPGAFVRRSSLKAGGKFLTAPDIEKLNAPHTPGLVARLTGGFVQEILGTMTVGSYHSGKSCSVPVFINDMAMPQTFDLRGILVSDIVAMEVYSGAATIPLEMGGTRRTDVNCGIVVIWLKERR